MTRQPTPCARCKAAITSSPQHCWYCPAMICSACHDSTGHCGHPEADAENRRAAERVALDRIEETTP